MWIALPALLLLTVLECRFPLRRRLKENKARHLARNLGIAAVSAGVNALERLAVDRLQTGTGASQFGLLQRFSWPAPANVAAGILALDYTLYLWHRMTHRVPVLWRCHLPHHVDLDMDASTALRFHAGELALSVPYRCLVVAFFGISRQSYLIWQTLMFLSIQFHHANIELPARLEHFLSLLIMTPRLHGIHHHSLQRHTDSNWSSGMTIWDRLHGTYVADPEGWREASMLNMGVPAWQDPEDIRFSRLMTLPFEPERDDWRETSLLN